MLNAVKIHNVHIFWGFVMTAVRLSYQAVAVSFQKGDGCEVLPFNLTILF